VNIEDSELSQSPLPHAVIGQDGLIRSVNDAWAAFFVAHPKNCLGETAYRLIDPADRTSFLIAWENLQPDDTVARDLRPARGTFRGSPLTWLFRSYSGRDEVVVTILVTHGVESSISGSPEDGLLGFDSQLLAALDDLGNGLAVFAAERMVWVNDAMARIFGYTREEMLGTDGFQLVADHDRPFVVKRRRQRIAGEEPDHHYEFDGRTKDAQVIRLEMSVHNSRVDPGRAVVVVRDVTEQRVRGERKRRAERMESLGSLAAALGREYNNIVMAYSLLTDALRDRLGGENVPTEIKRLDDVNRRALKLTRRLLTLEGRPLSQPAPIDANIVAWEAIERCDHLGVEIVPRLTPGLPTITLDRDQLEVVLVELIENAAAASHDGGIVLVETAERVISEHDELDEILDEGRYLVLRVVDDGEGIADEILEHVVEPFFTTRPLDATGLGLSTAYAIVRGLGGHLAVHSRDRVGTHVEVFLPVAAGADRERPLSRPKIRRMLPETVRVMLVDSSEVLRELLAHELGRQGFEVTTMASPGEAFACIQSGNACDVIVAELVSVGGDGFDFVRRLRGEHLDVCVVLTSGRTDVPETTLGGAIPNVGFLHKPFTTERLAAEIRSVLETRTEIL
jgi:PAS domain S-box-containing protein